MASISAIIFAICVITVLVHAQEPIEALGKKVSIPEGCIQLQSSRDSQDTYNFCPDKPDNYPQEEVDAYIKAELEERLTAAKTTTQYEMGFKKDPGCRKQEHKNCCSESGYQKPYFIRSVEDKTKLVIQSDYFQQVIKVTKCSHAGTECFSDLLMESFGYKTKCVTNYGTTKILVYNHETKKTETVPATFPVACSCVIYK